MYFKKLFMMLLFTVLSVFVAFLITAVVFGVSGQTAEPEKAGLIFSVTVAVALTLAMFVIGKARVNMREKRTAYMNSLQEKSFTKNVFYVIKSKDYIAEISAAETITVLLALVFCIVATLKNFVFFAFLITFIVFALIGIILIGIVFSAFDIALWLLVYKNWRKS
ncbi:MAG: hypothetical protein KBS52_02210 [Clostridiales bacterium]|nr:hypothetical protein [Candidatus Equinaster intestinalis]